jgi:hypothetical protein
MQKASEFYDFSQNSKGRLLTGRPFEFLLFTFGFTHQMRTRALSARNIGVPGLIGNAL